MVVQRKARPQMPHQGLDYLKAEKEGYPKRIFWKVIAPKGAKISKLQQSDAIFDDYDLKIRKLI